MTRSRDTANTQLNSGGAISPYLAGKNAIINGGFDFWQRGTSAAGSYPTYLADRWMNYRSTTGSTFSRQTTSDTANLPDIQYAVRMQRDSGNTSTVPIFSAHSLESIASRQFSGKTVTLSWYARAGANLSSSGNSMGAYLFSGTGTDQNTIAGFTGQAVSISDTKTLTTNWQRFTSTATIPATSTQIGVQLFFTPTGTAGSADYIEITGVQLELGSVATPFSRAGGTIQGELAACQRYYQRAFDISGMEYAVTQSGNSVFMSTGLPVEMRINPSASTTMTNANYGSPNWVLTQAGIAPLTKSGTISSFGLGGIRARSASIAFIGSTYSGTPNGFQNLASGTIYLELNAEL